MAVKERLRVVLLWVFRFAQVLGLTAVLTVSLCAGVILHASTPPARRLAAQLLTRGLSDFFQGTITISEVSEISLRGVTTPEARVQDPEGNTVLVVSDLRARTDVLGMVRTLLWGGQRISLVVNHVRAERAEVFIAPDDASGIPTIAAAFTPVPSPPSSTSSDTGPGRYVRTWLPNVEIGRVYARGRVADLPTLELSLAGVRGSVLASPKGAAIDVQRYGVVVRGLGGTDATGTGDIHIRAPGAVWTSFDGFFGNLTVGAFVHVKGDKIDARLDLPQAKPIDVQGLWVDYPLHVPVTAHAEARGTLDTLQTSLRLESGNAKVTASGPLTLSPELGAKLDVEGRSFDLQALFPQAPVTSIDLDSSISIWNKRGQLVVDANGTTAASKVAKMDVPPMDVKGTYNEKGFAGTATLHEDGMPLKLDFQFHPEGPIDLTARARAFTIEKAPRVKALTGARGQADVTVKARIEKEQLDASVVANVRSFKVGDVSVKRAALSGRAKGPLARPKDLDVNATLSGAGLLASGMSFGKVDLSAKGNVLKPKVNAKLADEFGPNVNASATVAIQNPPRVDNLAVEVNRKGTSLSGKIARLDLGSREVFIEDLSLAGAGGTLAGSVRVSPTRIVARAKGEDLDLDAIARALGLQQGTLGGRLRIDTDLDIRNDRAQGHLHFALGKGSVMGVGGIALRVNANVAERRFDGDLSGTVEGIGNIGGAWQTELEGKLLDANVWKRWTGLAQIHASELNLGLLTYALPGDWGVEAVEGKAFTQVRLERGDASKLPSVFWVGGTQQLAVEYGGQQRVEGIDVQVGGGLDGASGDISATTRLVDAQGVLASLSGSLRANLEQLIATPERALAILAETKMEGALMIPERRLDQLPEPLRTTSIDGSVEARVTWVGPPKDPVIGGTVTGRGLRAAGSRLALPADLQVTAKYEPKSGRYAGTAELSQAKRRAAWMLTTGNYQLGGTPTGGVQMILERAPLGLVPFLADGRVTGALSGTVALQRPEGAEVPYATANLQLLDVTVDRVPVGEGTMFMRTDGRSVNAKAELTKQNSRLSLTAGAGVAWKVFLPELDEERPVRLTLEARSFDAVVLSPFLRDMFSRLGGDIDAGLAATLVAEKRSSETHWTGKIAGYSTLRNGLVQIAPLGLEIRDLSLRADARDAGRFTAIDLKDVKGTARSKDQTINARATLYFDGVRLESADAYLRIVNLPLLVQGVSQANATGNANLTLNRQDARMLVEVDIPYLEARLPQASGRRVIELDDNPNIAVVQPLREPSAFGGDRVLPWRFVVKLGNSVSVNRNDLVIPVSGQPVVELGQEVAVMGYVDLRAGGRIQALGKSFVVEHGRVLFDTEDPTDPHLTALASWRAPDGSTVYLEVTGTLKDARLRVTSPDHSEDEAMALLLGGGGDLATGAGIGALNAIFGDALQGRVEVRTATYEDKSAHTVAVNLGENIWFEGTYRQSAQTVQSSTGADKVDVSGTIDWRFRHDWSLRTEIGTLGTGLDLLWQYRY
ncbi:MAG: translocation/assembly module TamB domain-containing protein [Polyangiaceae bacterium]